jgi:hypothetical protein
VNVSFVGCNAVEHILPKRGILLKNPHSVTTQKTNNDIFTAVRTSHLKQAIGFDVVLRVMCICFHEVSEVGFTPVFRQLF